MIKTFFLSLFFLIPSPIFAMAEPNYTKEYVNYTNQAVNISLIVSIIATFFLVLLLIGKILKNQNIPILKIIVLTITILALSLILFIPFLKSVAAEAISGILLGPPDRTSFFVYLLGFFLLSFVVNAINPNAYFGLIIYIIFNNFLYKSILKIKKPTKNKNFLISLLTLPYILSINSIIIVNIYKIINPFLGQKFK